MSRFTHIPQVEKVLKYLGSCVGINFQFSNYLEFQRLSGNVFSNFDCSLFLSSFHQRPQLRQIAYREGTSSLPESLEVRCMSESLV